MLGGGGVDEHRGAAGEQSAGGDGHGFVGWCEACFSSLRRVAKGS